MSALDKALETQLSNIETRTGKTRAQLSEAILAQGLAKHGDMVKWVKESWGLGHGDANTLVHIARQSVAGEAEAAGDPLDQIYVGAKADQRAIHTALMAQIDTFGDFEIAPKKGYVALRRKKQFAMLGPKTNTRFELGVNLKETVDHPLAAPVKPGGMCQYVISLHSVGEVDAGVIEIVRRAYDAAG